MVSVSPLDRENDPVDAQKVEADCGRSNAAPNLQRHPLMEKDAQNGDQNQVHRGDKSGLPHCGIGDANLLEQRCDGQHHTTGNSALHQLFFPGGGHRFQRSRPPFPPVCQQNKRDKGGRPQQAPDGLKGKGPNIIHADTLGHKGKAPDHSSQQQSRVGVYFFHSSTGSSLVLSRFTPCEKPYGYRTFRCHCGQRTL